MKSPSSGSVVNQNPHAEGGTSPPATNKKDIHRTLKLLMVDGATSEICILDGGRRQLIVGYFNELIKAGTAATALSGEYPGVYITLNPAVPDLLGRGNNQMVNYAPKRTADSEIASRRWVLMDFDPARPEGVSSTDAEHALAIKTAQTVRDWLVTLGVPANSMVLADSGNGGHLVLRIDLPNDPASLTLVTRCLTAVSEKFATKDTLVDLKVGNAARLTKLYGTLVKKGFETPDRHHRVSAILSMPVTVEVCPREALEALAALAPAKPTSLIAPTGQSFDIDGYIAHHGAALQLKEPKAWQGGRLWEFTVCPFDQTHEQNGAAQLIQMASGAISASCHHARCAGKGWPELKALFPPPRKPTTKQAPAADGKPTIVVSVSGEHDKNDLHTETFEAVVTLNRAAPRVFQRSMYLVRVRPDDDGYPTIETFSEPAFTGYLAQAIRWLTVSMEMEGSTPAEGDEGKKPKMKRSLKAINPPASVIKNILNRPEWPGIHVLRSIAQTPVFLQDGTLVTERGYHADAQLWYEPPPNFEVVVPEEPTPQQIAKSRDLLLGMIQDFPFADDKGASRAHALAYFLLPFCRLMINGPTPLHVFDAPSQGSGKGLLVELGCMMSTGLPAPMVSVPERDENELRKRITSLLLGGPPHIIFDNLKYRLDSASVASALIAGVWADRTLGVSKVERRLEIRSTWVATGNNIELARDIARRSIVCRIEPDVEDPYLRGGFKEPKLLLWASEHRSELVSAALTLIRGWIVAGRPAVPHQTIGAFEAWADTLAGVLGHAGVKGFLENFVATAGATDPATEAWRDFIQAWWKAYGSQPATSTDLAPSARLLGIVKVDENDVLALGHALAKKKGRIISGLRIEKADERKARGWKLTPVTPATVATVPTVPPAHMNYPINRVGEDREEENPSGNSRTPDATVATVTDHEDGSEESRGDKLNREWRERPRGGKVSLLTGLPLTPIPQTGTPDVEIL